MNTIATRQHLRRRMQTLRSALSAADRQQASAAILGHLSTLPAFATATGIHCYLSLPEEVDTTAIFAACLRLQKRTYVPVQRPGHTLTWCAWQPGQPLLPGPFGIPQPPLPLNYTPPPPEAIHCILLPGLAFTPQGQRLGYGYGFYDRWLAQLASTRTGGLPHLIGLGFHFQRVQSIPSAKHDLPIHWLITEQGSHTCQ